METTKPRMGSTIGKLKLSKVELENRRRLAVARVKQGYTQREVARFWGVHEDTVGQPAEAPAVAA